MHSTVNNSATQTSLAMILDTYESPTHRLSYAVPFYESGGIVLAAVAPSAYGGVVLTYLLSFLVHNKHWARQAFELMN